MTREQSQGASKRDARLKICSFRTSLLLRSVLFPPVYCSDLFYSRQFTAQICSFPASLLFRSVLFAPVYCSDLFFSHQFTAQICSFRTSLLLSLSPPGSPMAHWGVKGVKTETESRHNLTKISHQSTWVIGPRIGIALVGIIRQRTKPHCQAVPCVTKQICIYIEANDKH